MVEAETGADASAKGRSVSVIVPVFNDERFIVKCLASLSRQQGVDYDVIVVFDDGSTDNSREAIRAWEGREGFRVVVVPHCTIGHALNIGLANSAGGIVAFAEADKIFDSLWLKNAVDYLQDHPNVLGVGSLATPPETRSFVGKCLKEMKEIHLKQLNHVREIEWSYVYRRSALDKVGGWNEALPVGEDRDLAKRVIATGGKLHLIRKADNIHYLSGIYDGIGPILKKQYSTGTKHAIHRIRSLTSGWMISIASVLGVLLLVAGFDFHALFLVGGLLLAAEYSLRLVKFLHVGRGTTSVRVVLLPLLAVSMNLAYGIGLLSGTLRSHRNR